MAKFQMSWDAPEFEYREKGPSWYWISIIIAAAIIGFSVWTANFLFGFFIVLAEVLLIIWANRVPRMITFTIDDEGITIDGLKFHSLKEFESWSMDPLSEEWVELYFNTRSKVRVPIKVLFPKERLQNFRDNLKTVLREVEHEPSFIDTIEKFIKF